MVSLQVNIEIRADQLRISINNLTREDANDDEQQVAKSLETMLVSLLEDVARNAGIETKSQRIA